MNAFKNWYLTRLPREKILALAFALLGALIWLSGAAERLGAARKEHSGAASELATQKLWLDNRATIEEAAATAVKNLEPSKTLDSTYLVAQVQGMASRAGLQVTVEPPRTQRSAQFSVHTVLVRSQRAQLDALIRFYQELASKAPYVGLEQVILRIDRAAVGAVNADFQVTSVELVR